MTSSICIEACIASPEDALEAYAGGADRLELNMALELDGLTPTLGLLREVKKQAQLPVIVMVRPRSNGFVYSDAEFRAMQADIDLLLTEGADGFAFGILDNTLRVDVTRTHALVRQIGDKDAVFHRAFDVTENPMDAMEQLIDCGIERVLTSGCKNSALEGVPLIRRLIEKAQNRIEILPGGGITPHNVGQLINLTGCTQIHGTFKQSLPSHSSNPHSTSGLDRLRDPAPAGTHRDTIQAIRKIVTASV